MLKRILSYMDDQGYDQDALLNLQQINYAFDIIISGQSPTNKSFPRHITQQIWELTQSKTQSHQVILSDFLTNMEKHNKLRHLLPQSVIYDHQEDHQDNTQDNTHHNNQSAFQTLQPSQILQEALQFPIQYKPQQAPEQPQVITQNTYQQPINSNQQQPTNTQQILHEPQVQEYSERESIEVRNLNYTDSISHNINGTIAESEGNIGSIVGQDSFVTSEAKPTEPNLNENSNIQNTHPQNINISEHEHSVSLKNDKKTQPSTLRPANTNSSTSEKPKKSNVEDEDNEKRNIITKSQIEPQTPKKQIKPKNQPKHTSEITQRKNQELNTLTDPLLQYNLGLTEQERQDRLIKDIPRPELKNKSGYRSLLKSNSQSAYKNNNFSSTLVDGRLQGSEGNLDNQGLLVDKKKKKCMSKKWCIPMCLFVVGLVVFLSSFLIHAELKKLAAQQVILGPDNQKIWAHFPGYTQTQIDRNWTFFTLKNPDQFLFYNQKPQFREIKGFKIIQLEDYLNITYIQDGNRVQMLDWLHFEEQPETRNLDQKVQILNVGGLAYWYNIKVARPTVILQQGLGLLFNTLETSILENIFAQTINVQFLPQWSEDVYAEMFAPVDIPFEQAWFIWSDPAYGMGKQDNLKYWIQAVNTEADFDNQTVSQEANFLMDYFTLSLPQMKFISGRFAEFIDFATSSVLQNSYCTRNPNCTGRYLAYQQFSTSYVTRNPPPGKPITPNDTICETNKTCDKYFPQLSAFYKNVYLQRNPDAEKSLQFDPEWMGNLVNYNFSIEEGLDYNTAENCLFHIGNLDALWGNGTMYQNSLQNSQLLGQFGETKAIPNKYLQNIMERFNLPSVNHTLVFWSWAKYLYYELVLQNNTNEQLGVANLFANGLYEGFSHLQDNLQPFLLTELIYYDLLNEPVGDCTTFIRESFDLRSRETASNICDKHGQKITKDLVKSLLTICTNEFKEGWLELRHRHGLTLFQLQSLCQYDELNKGTFGYWLHRRRLYLNKLYNCEVTPKQYCSDYELAVIQWASSGVTLNPPQQLNLTPNHSYKGWDSKAPRFEYGFYRSKYPQDDSFPEISTRQGYALLNFDNWFSAPVVLKQFTNQSADEKFKAYMRYVALEVGLNGLTMERTAREIIFGYEDEILEQVKNAYPPFGGDPSTPSLIAFNDPNITKQQATMTLEWSTGKENSSLVGQYRKINGLQYLTISKDFFNGNLTQNQLISPWDGEDYVYGTTAKQFSPNQFDQPNISLYVPNIQRYGSGVIDDSSIEERFGFEVEVGVLGQSIYESTQQSDLNKKYYQTFYAMFNQTSVVGFPLFVTKNHFMNISDNWTCLVEIWDENSTIHYVNVSRFDDSFVVVQPYTGLSFQSTIFLQSNYHHTPDSLLNFYQESMLPVFSLARSGNITESVVDELLGPLKMGIAAVQWFKIVGIVLVVVSCLVCGYVYYRKKKEDQKKAQHGEESDTEHEQSQRDDTPRKEKRKEREIKSSQLGISLQPMSSAQNLTKQQYVPPAVIEQEI